MQKSTERACEACGEPFPIHPRERNRRRFCDATCAHWAKRNPGQKRQVERTCENCAARFQPALVTSRFCSAFCADLARGVRVYGPKGGAIVCEMCDERKVVPVVGNTKSCLDCRDEWVRQTQAGWRSRNPERVREWDRTRDRREYQNVRSARLRAERQHQRLLEAARACAEWAPLRTPLMLPRPVRAPRELPLRFNLRPASAAYSKSLLLDPCAYCGGPGGQRDHIVPRAHAGGVTGSSQKYARDADNLTGCCAACNLAKADSSLLEFLL